MPERDEREGERGRERRGRRRRGTHSEKDAPTTTTTTKQNTQMSAPLHCTLPKTPAPAANRQQPPNHPIHTYSRSHHLQLARGQGAAVCPTEHEPHQHLPVSRKNTKEKEGIDLVNKPAKRCPLHCLPEYSIGAWLKPFGVGAMVIAKKSKSELLHRKHTFPDLESKAHVRVTRRMSSSQDLGYAEG